MKQLHINDDIKNIKKITHFDENNWCCVIICEDGSVYKSGHLICVAIENNKKMKQIIEPNGKIINQMEKI